MMKKEKTTRWLGMVILAFVMASFIFPKTAKADSRIGVSFQVFYDELAPYGDWVNDPRYGYIWLPYVGADFHPYGSHGHWAMTQYGNTWVSHYEWGWAPFHYGRWLYDDYYGWAWVPGYEWGPAWVNWRTGGGFYGWAPLGPGVSIHVGIHIPAFHWVFVPHRRFTSRHIYRYYAPRTRIRNIYRHTTIINNTYIHNKNVYISGPDRRHIQRYARSSVPVYRIHDSGKPGRASLKRNTLNIYRPDVRASSRSVNTRPSRVTSAQKARSNRSSWRTESRNNSPRMATPSRRPSVSERKNVSRGSSSTYSRGKSNQIERRSSAQQGASRNPAYRGSSRNQSPKVVKPEPYNKRVQKSTTPSRRTERVNPRERSKSSSPQYQQRSSQSRGGTIKKSSSRGEKSFSSRSSGSRRSSPSISNSSSKRNKSVSASSSRRSSGNSRRGNR
ncbi:hypothetical protein QWY93_00680 [Echinicola jeungdonensis]|uniref:DUF6600 domain-containing protein n=1 Tax=Echinicola jeungdonensis TaxID=709343 RepID=A0ABV5J281_9BACT|nr:DUF6600 domain-containing protein [Echinicola jeungdonensis]MDN3667855.1 hypothetical protein [Echinicola jeungdonensis]